MFHMFKGNFFRNILIIVLLLVLSIITLSCNRNIPCPAYAENDYQTEDNV